MFLDWVKGVLIRPGETFAQAEHHLRFGYWWILLSVFSLEVVGTIYSPQLEPELREQMGIVVLWSLTVLMLLFDLQALLLVGAARILGWQLTWRDSLKYIGLSWSVILLESATGFVPALLGYSETVLWMGIPFGLWYVAALFAGVRRVTGFTSLRALALTLMAAIPWQAGLFWLNWRALHP